MTIYNVTLNLEPSIHEAGLNWIKQQHIKKVLATGKFTDARLVKVLVEEKIEGHTYSIQFTAKSRKDLEAYYQNDANALEDEAAQLFGDKMLSFKTELEVLRDFTI